MVKLTRAGLFLTVFLSFSCGMQDLDFFPPDLSYLVAERDAYGDFEAAGLTYPIWIGRMELLRIPDTDLSALFVFAQSYGERWLFVYDPDTLALRRTYSGGSLSNLLAVSPGRNYLCGGTEIDPGTLEVLADAAPTAAFGYSDTLSFLDAATSNLYVFYPSAIGLSCVYFSPASWASATPVPIGDVSVLSDLSTGHRPVDLLVGADGAFRLLFDSGGMLRELAFPDFPALLAVYGLAAPLDTAASMVVMPGSSDQPGSWLTRDGAVRLSRDKRTRLVRHHLDIGVEIDAWTEAEDVGPVRYHFFESGSRWLSLSEDRGTLRLLRTWW